MWDFFKPTNKMSSEEIRLRETFEYLLEIEERLKKIELVLDELYFKALASNGLLLVRGISEDKPEEVYKPTD